MTNSMIFTIGGNIGCGKSTVLHQLQSEYTTFTEPVDKWGAWLDLFYKDPVRNALPFQMKVLMEFTKIPDVDKIVTERSPQDSLHVFSKSLPAEEYALYEEYVDTLGWRPDVYIYLRTDPEVCMARIEQRNRPAEDRISIEYIRTLHERYEAFVDTLPHVHKIDGNQTTAKILDAVKNIMYLYI